jgi:hypothetical protein
MSKKTAQKKTAQKTISLSELSKTPIELAGKTYYLCYDMDALSDAEEFFNQRGAKVNLLKSLSSLGLSSVRQVFPCAVHTFHPELSYKEAQKLLTIQASYEVAASIVAIWTPAAGVDVQAPPA